MKKLKRPKILAILMITLIICTIPMTVFAATDMRADMNSDGKVNSADAIYLLRHTIMSDKYPIANAGDMNGDGRINSADAIYLLRHTIMPDKYPIKSECVHNEVIDLGINATCTKIGLTEGKHCSICGTVFQKQEIIPKLDHIMNNGECVNCGYEFIDYSDLDLYDSTYGFEYLGTLPKGKSLQEFYKRLDNVAKTFHSNTTMDASISTLNGKGQLSEVYYKDIGLSYEDAVMTLSIFKKDHPIYYWLANRWIYNSTSGWLRLNVDPAYIKGEDRAYYNELIYDGIKSYTSIAQGETSPYLITLAYHDAILSSVEYAYEQDGKTPVSAIWAHSIMGVFDKKGVVCEGYAKTLQLLLNFSGIKNVLVDGISNSLHAWNLICLDDGQWYWCDATWNDSDGYRGDIKYNYFCVNDTQFINWSDELLGWNNPIFGSKSFIDSHTPFDPSANDAWRKQYVLPERAPCIFDNDSVLELREIFTIGDYTYALTGYNKVQLISVKNRNALIIPEYVVYDDTVYQVTSIGSMLDNGFFTANNSISTNAMTKIIMPSSIEYIWDYALSMDNTTIYYGDTAENWEKLHKNNHVFNDAKIYYYSETMPEENDKFWHYYKGEVTVWQYHQHIEIVDPAITPSCTEDGLTEGKHCSICDEIIVKQEIVPAIGHDFVDGFCYVCGEKYVTPYEYFIFTLLDDDTYEIKAKNVYDMPENVVIPEKYNGKTVTRIGHIAFQRCGKLKSVEISKGITDIDSWAFAGCKNLNYVIVSDSVKSIDMYAFAYCDNLKNIKIPTSVENIADISPFADCNILENIEVDENNQYFKSIDGVLYNKAGTKLHSYPAGKKDEFFEIPNGVKIVGLSAFDGCSNLTGISIHDSVTKIGSNDDLFGGCINLINIQVDENNQYYKSVNGILYTKSGAVLLKYPAKKVDTTFTIPDIVTIITNSAFEDCTNLTNIYISDGVTSIGSSAFYNCSNLTSINIPESVTSIGWDAFDGCSSLMNIILPESVMNIDSYTFYGCSKLNQIVLPKSINAIDKNAFYGCNTLDTVFYTGIPVDWNTMTIGENNTSLTKANIYFYSQYHPTNNCTAYWHYENDTPTIWGHNEVVSTGVPATCTQSGLTDGTHCSYCSITIKQRETIPPKGHNYQHGKCTYCGEVGDLGELSYALNADRKSYSVTGIGSYVGLNVIIPETYKNLPVTSIGAYAFNGCEQIISIYIPDTITSIGEYALNRCVELKHIYYKDSKTSWENIANENLSDTEEFYIHCNVRDYGIYFEMDSVSFPEIYSHISLDDVNERIIIDQVALLPLNGYDTIKIYDIKNNEIVSLNDTNFEIFCSTCGLDGDRLIGKIEMQGDNVVNVSLLKVSYINQNGERIFIEDGVYVFVAESDFSTNSSKIHFTDSEKEYIKFCLEMFEPLRRVYSCSDNIDSDFNGLEKALLNVSRWDDTFKNFVKFNPNLKKEQLKVAFANFVQSYIDNNKNINSSEETEKNVKICMTLAQGLVDFYETGKFSKELTTDLKTVADIYMQLKNNGADYEDIQALLEVIVKTIKNPEFKKVFENSIFWKNAFRGNEVSFNKLSKVIDKCYVTINKQWFKKAFFDTSTLSGKIGVGLDAIEGVCVSVETILYVANDYSNNIEILEAVRKQLIKNGFNESDEILQVMDELIEEYEHKYTTGLLNFLGEFAYWVFDKIANSVVPIFSVTTFIGEITMQFTPIDEQFELCALYCFNDSLYLSCQPIKTLTLKGEVTDNLSNLKQSAEIYFNYVLYMNKKILEITKDEATKQSLQSNIDYIERYLEEYITNGSMNKPVIASGLHYQLNSDKKSYSIIGIGNCSDTVFEIPKIYNGLPVTKITANAFKNCTQLKNVIIPDSIIEIGKGAFSGCSFLESITIPFVGSSINPGEEHFNEKNCFGYIFGDEYYEGSYLVNQFVFCIDGRDFYIPQTLQNVTMTGNRVNYGSFSCLDIPNIYLTGKVTSIPSDAFVWNIGITEIKIPAGCTQIGYTSDGLNSGGVFSGCENLQVVYIPLSLKNIDIFCFDDCDNITDVYYEGSEEDWKNINIDRFNKCLTNANIHYNYDYNEKS